MLSYFPFDNYQSKLTYDPTFAVPIALAGSAAFKGS